MKTLCILFTVLILLVSSLTSAAQDSIKSEEKTREYVLSFQSFAPFTIGIKYKRQLKNKMFFKIGLVDLSGFSSSNKPSAPTNPTSVFSISGGLGFGLEFRKIITNDFTFFHGPGLNVSFSTSISKIDDPTLPPDDARRVLQQNSTGVNYGAGLLFHLKNHFYLSAELSPSLTYSKTKDNKNNETYNINFSLRNTNGLISIVYRL